MKKTITVDTLDMVKLTNGTHNCVAIFKATISGMIRLTGIKLFHDPVENKWWMKFPVNESNHKKLPFFSFVSHDDYHTLLECAKDGYLSKDDSYEEDAYMG